MAGDLRTTVFEALTGKRSGDLTGHGDVLAQLLTIGGESSRTKSGIDLTRAAKRLRCSRRTVERWVHAAETGTGQHPSKALGDKLARQARQTATTKRGRKAAMRAARRGVGPAGKRLTISGLQGPRRAGTDYARQRDIVLTLTPDQAQEMFDAYEEGGEQGWLDWAQQWSDENYLDQWQILDVSGLTVDNPRRDWT